MAITDTELKLQGIQALTIALGEVHAERFISLILKEPFDYTQWQRDLWATQSLEELSQAAMVHWQTQEK
jgi:hypothetical protein